MKIIQFSRTSYMLLAVCLTTIGCSENEVYRTLAGQYELILREEYHSQSTEYGMYSYSYSAPITLESRQILVLTEKGDAIRYQGNKQVAAITKYDYESQEHAGLIYFNLNDGMPGFEYSDSYRYNLETHELTRGRYNDVYRGYGHTLLVWMKTR